MISSHNTAVLRALAKTDRQAPQHPENFHDKHYDNDVGHQWTRGWDGDKKIDGAYPNFDHSRNRPPMQANKGDTWPESNRQNSERYGGGGMSQQLRPERNRDPEPNTPSGRGRR